MAVSGRYVYCLSANANPTDFDPRDGAGGYVPVIYYLGSFFERDGTDTTTPASAVCLVTIDGSRYKVTDYDLLMGYSIVAADVTTPPDPDDVDEAERPVEGQAWRVPAGATGEWAAYEDYIAIWTARSWAYVAPKIGRLVYNEATGGYEHINADGVWTNGVGNNPIANGVILPSMMVGGGGRQNWIVESQTENTPPTAVDGVNYVIGSSPTGRWAGLSGNIAAGESGGETIYEPSEGWTIYDKATDGRYNHDGSNWVSAFGNFTITRRTYVAGTTWAKPARMFLARVYAVGAGGGSGTSATSGGTSSFGAYLSATGGGGGTNLAAGAAGAGTGGDINLSGEVGMYFSTDNISHGGAAAGPYGGKGSWNAAAKSYGGGGSIPNNFGGSGGGCAEKVFLASDLTSNVTVTVGAGGTAAGGTSGAGGAVIVDEYTFN